MLSDPSTAEMGIYTFGDKSPNYIGTCQYYIKVSGLRDPGSSGAIRAQFPDGRAGGVQDYLKEDKRVEAIIGVLRMIAFMHLRSKAADKKWLSFALVDHHGKWIAPAIGEMAADVLSNIGYKVSLYHADLAVRAVNQ